MEDDDRIAWKLVSTEHVVQDEWIDFRRESYQFPDGSVHGPFYTMTRSNYAVIAARTESGKWLLVHQYRQGIKRTDDEFPAGKIEDGEDALHAAERELREETGYESSDWTHLLDVPSSPTECDNVASLFLARNCRRVSEQHLDALEYLSFKEVSTEELDEMIRDGRFAQPVHIACRYLAHVKD